MFEHVAAQQIVRVYEEAWPAEHTRVSTKWTANRGVVSLVTFFTRVKKVTGMPGHPGGFLMGIATLHPSYGYSPSPQKGEGIEATSIS